MSFFKVYAYFYPVVTLTSSQVPVTEAARELPVIIYSQSKLLPVVFIIDVRFEFEEQLL